MDLQHAEQIAFRLGAHHPNLDVAFIVKDQRIYASACPRQKGPSSAVIKLLQGVFDENRDLSFFILRRRIFTTAPIQEQSRAMVRVVAKRLTHIQAKNHSIPIEHEVQWVGEPTQFLYPSSSVIESQGLIPPKDQIQSIEEGVCECEKLAKSIPQNPVRHDQNRAIAAILYDNQGRLLAWSTNEASLNKTLHAEVRLIQKFFANSSKPIPAGAQMFISLKPCVMCAAMIAENCEDLSKTKIYYLENDQGPLAQRTALENQIIFKKQ